MKKVIISIITVFILFILQSSLFHYLAFNGIVPNLMLIVVCFYGYHRSENAGIIAGFFCGLLLDIFYMDYIGFHSLILIFIGFFNGLLNHFYIEENNKIPLICCIVSDLVFSIITYGLQFLLNGKFNIEFYLIKVILPELIYTTVLAILLFPLLYFIEYKVIPIKEKEEEEIDV